MMLGWVSMATTGAAIDHPLVDADKPFFIDHPTADFMKVLHKLSLADSFIVTEKTEKMWDFDQMQDVMDIVGYNLWYTE